MFRSVLLISIFSLFLVEYAIAQSDDVVTFNKTEYRVTGIAVSKSSSARLARFGEQNPEILRKYIYLPAGTILFLLDRYEEARRFQLAVTQHGMPLYVLPRLNYFPAGRFTGMKGEYAAIPRTNIVVKSKVYDTITLTPSEVYSMKFLDNWLVAITVGKLKMGAAYTEDDVVEVAEDRIAYVPLPIDDGARPPTPTQIYDFNSALDDILEGVTNQDVDKLKKFKNYASSRFVSRKECEEEIDYGYGVDAGLAAEFDSWLSPIEGKLALTGSYKSTRKYARGTEFTVERYDVHGKIYEIKDESVAKDCVNLEENRRIRIAAGRIAAQLNTKDASDLKLGTDPKGRIVYTCRDEYLKIEKSLLDQELDLGPARLLISRFTIYEDIRDAARCVTAR